MNEPIVCIASVIDTPERWNYFKQCVDSIKNQHDKPRGVCLSIHVVPGVGPSSQDVRRLCKGMTEQSNDTKILWQTRKLRQFQHYQRINNKLSDWFPDAEWLMFSDDDDLWSPNRYTAYKTCILGHRDNSVDCICSNEICLQNPDCCAVESVSDVDRIFYWCSCITFKQLFIVPRDARLNYVHYAVRVKRFRSFFVPTHDYIINHNRFCDMFFVDHCEAGNVQMLPLSLFQRWLYFHRRWSQTVTAHNIANVEEWSDVDVQKYSSYMAEYLEYVPHHRANLASLLSSMLVLAILNPDAKESVYETLKTVVVERRELAATFGAVSPVPHEVENMASGGIAKLLENDIALQQEVVSFVSRYYPGLVQAIQNI